MPKPLLAAAGVALAAALAATPAGAAEDKKPVVDRVDLNKVGLPIVWRGRLVNYVFATVRLKLAPGRDGKAVRAKEPYLRDALVRTAHLTPFVDPADLSRVDERAVDAAVMRDAGRIVGPGVVAAVEVLVQQPRRRLPRPQPATPAGRPITP